MIKLAGIDYQYMNTDSFFLEIFQKSPVPNIILKADSPEFTIIEVNELYLELSGRSRTELMGRGFFDCGSHPAMLGDSKSIDLVRQTFDQLVQNKKLVRGAVHQYIQSPIDGVGKPRKYYLQASNKPIFDNNKEIKYIIRALKDVTETVDTQNKERKIYGVLKESERFLTDTQRAGRIGSWEFDQNYRVRWSEIHYEIYETEEGFQPTMENIPIFLKGKSSMKRLREIFNDAVSTGKAFDEEFEIVTAKGNLKWIRLAGRVEVKNGVFKRLYGTTQDITSQKALEMQLVDSRNQFETMVQTIHGVVWEADVDTLKMTFISEQIKDMLGYTKEECLQEPKFWQNHLHPEGKEEVVKQTLARVKACSDFTSVYRVQKKDGSYIWLQASFSMVCINGSPKQIRGLMTDVTATKLVTDLEHLEKTVLELNSKPSVSLYEVLEIYVHGIEKIFPQMICSITRIKNARVHHWVSFSLPSAYVAAIENQPIGENSGSCGTAAFRKQMVIVNDIATDPLWAGYKEVALKAGLRACWSYPIVNSRGEVLAALAMYYTEVKNPTEDELKVIERTAAILKVIIEQRHYAELLEETNFLMKQSQELAHFGNIQWDIANDKLTWSKELYSIFGIATETKITQKGHFDWIHPDDLEQTKANVDNLFSSKEDQIFEERIVRPDGEVRHLKTWLRLKTDEQGNPVRMIGACLDTTESKQYEERLIASEQRLRHILDSQTNYVVRIGLDFKYRYVNKKFMEDFAQEEETSLIGSDSLKTVKEEEKKQVQEIILRCIDEPGKVISIELEKLSHRYPNKATYWHFICLTDSDGVPQEIQGIGIDISERKKAEEDRKLKTLELEASKKRYSDLFHLSPQPMYLFDEESLRFLDVNTAAIQQYEYSREEFLTMTIRDIKPEEEIPELLEELARAKKDKTDFYRGIYVQRTKRGELIHVDLHSNLILFEGRKARLVLASNITERMAYLKALEIQNTKLREIAWTQSHVVRAPLARIMALIDMIKNYPELNQENLELLSYVFISAVELDEIIKEIASKAEEVEWDKERPEGYR